MNIYNITSKNFHNNACVYDFLCVRFNEFFSLFKHMEYVKLRCTQRKNRITQFPS